MEHLNRLPKATQMRSKGVEGREGGGRERGCGKTYHEAGEERVEEERCVLWEEEEEKKEGGGGPETSADI